MDVDPGSIGLVLLQTAWFVGAAAWFLSLAEAIATWRFWGWAYRLGPCVLRETRPSARQSGIVAVGQTLETPHGKFKLVQANRFLFRARAGAFGAWTPFPVMGSLQAHERHSEVEGRIPLFPTLFVGAWLVGWSGGSTLALATPGGRWVGFGFLLVGVGVGALMAFLIRLEVRRARRLLEEFSTGGPWHG